MPEIALGRVISGQREISRDTLERAARAATGLGELGIGRSNASASFGNYILAVIPAIG
jgi:hypothetical protein